MWLIHRDLLSFVWKTPFCCILLFPFTNLYKWLKCHVLFWMFCNNEYYYSIKERLMTITMAFTKQVTGNRAQLSHPPWCCTSDQLRAGECRVLDTEWLALHCNLMALLTPRLSPLLRLYWDCISFAFHNASCIWKQRDKRICK